MTEDEIYENLCVYDKRSPCYEGLTLDMDKDEIPQARTNCYCDNCFYGRDKLACEILKQREVIL